jgi:hypothetical protein
LYGIGVPQDQFQPEPFPNARVLLSYPIYEALWSNKNGPSNPCDMGYVETLSQDAWRDRLVVLMETLDWSLGKGVAEQGFVGLTYYPPGEGPVTLLSAEFLQPLLKGGITLAERCQIYLVFAFLVNRDPWALPFLFLKTC